MNSSQNSVSSVMIIDVIVTRATCTFKSPLKIPHKEAKNKKEKLK
jgi:predicted small lipoprotein YifL